MLLDKTRHAFFSPGWRKLWRRWHWCLGLQRSYLCYVGLDVLFGIGIWYTAQVSWLEMLGRAGAVIPRIYFLLGVKARPWVTLWMRLAVGVEAGWKLDRKQTEFKEIWKPTVTVNVRWEDRQYFKDFSGSGLAEAIKPRLGERIGNI